MANTKSDADAGGPEDMKSLLESLDNVKQRIAMLTRPPWWQNGLMTLLWASMFLGGHLNNWFLFWGSLAANFAALTLWSRSCRNRGVSLFLYPRSTRGTLFLLAACVVFVASGKVSDALLQGGLWWAPYARIAVVSTVFSLCIHFLATGDWTEMESTE